MRSDPGPMDPLEGGESGDGDGWALPVLLVGAAVWNVVGNLFVPDAWYVPANLVATASVLAVGWRAGLSASELGLHRASLARGVRIGLGAAAVVAVVLGVALVLPATAGLLEDEVVAGDSAAMRWFRPLVRIPLGTVLVEELLFRSVLYALVLRRHGATAAVVVTAGLFGLWHVVPAWETAAASGSAVGEAVGGVAGGTALGAVVVTTAVTTAAGVLFALLRRWSGSVVAPVVAHVATNSFAYVAALIAVDVLP